MSTERNKAVVRDYLLEVWGNGRLELLDDIMLEDAVEGALPQIPGLNGRETIKAIIGGARSALPDVTFTIHDLIAERDRVTARLTFTATHQGEFMGAPPSGRRIKVDGAAIYRLSGGRIAEIWNFTDMLGMMQQLGLIPVPEAA
jgi:steroid delta-isomerase-like uncharacterized protein